MSREDKRDGRLEGHEVHLGSVPGATRAERPHGKVYRWLDNFWYHHKWKTIIISFFVLVFLICTLQMCTSEAEGDISVMMAGPYGFMSEDAGFTDLQNCLGTYLPADFDASGSKKVDIVSYTVFSEEQIKAYAAQGAQINTATNSSTYEQYVRYVQTGESSILFLDPWLYEEMKPNLMELKANLGYTPEGAIVSRREDGTAAIYGVRLGDTALYRENNAMQVLPEDTVICLAAPLYMGGKSSDEAEFAKAVEYLRALLKEVA